MFPKKLIREKAVLVNSFDDVLSALRSVFHVSYFTTTLRNIDLREDGTVTAEGRCWLYSESFMRAISKFIGMPLNYAHKIEFDLFKENFNQLKISKSCGVKICISGGHAVNVCKANLYPARSMDILEGLPENFRNFRFNEAIVSDSIFEVSWCDYDDPIHPQPDDNIFSGIKITNSETGFAGLKASMFTLRQTCSNGAVMVDEKYSVRWSSDRRMTYSRNIEKFCEKLKILEIPKDELQEKYASVFDRVLTDRETVNLWRRVRRLLNPVGADDILGFDSLYRQDLMERVNLYDNPYMAQATELNLYEVHNRVTASAKKQPPLNRMKLEEIGGGMIWKNSLN